MVSLGTFRVLGHILAGFMILGLLFKIRQDVFSETSNIKDYRTQKILIAWLFGILGNTGFIVGIEKAIYGVVYWYRNLFVLFSGICICMLTVEQCSRALKSENSDMITYVFAVNAVYWMIFFFCWWILNGVIRYVVNQPTTLSILLIVSSKPYDEPLVEAKEKKMDA